MWSDRVSNPGPLTYESGALPTALRGPAKPMGGVDYTKCDERMDRRMDLQTGTNFNALYYRQGGGGIKSIHTCTKSVCDIKCASSNYNFRDRNHECFYYYFILFYFFSLCIKMAAEPLGNFVSS